MQKPAVNVMVKAARAGGNVLLRHMHRLDAINVVEKDRFDYASEVDSLAEAEIIKELKRANPDYAILGEEGGKQKGIRDGGRFTWVIDPLDGTSNYLHGFPHWCVSIALVENGEPWLGRRAQRAQDPRQRAQGPDRRDAGHRIPAARTRACRRATRMPA
jgi:myo-inositol-1(or 4)-monophosphatase